jgi:FkbM family methyltransferase
MLLVVRSRAAFVVRQCLPPVLLHLARSATKWFERLDHSQIALRREFDALNEGVPPNQLALRWNLDLAIHPESRIPFEMFCWRSPAMVAELDAFLDQTATKKQLLDIGALHGIFSLAFAAGNEDRRAVAVDPSPLAFAKLLYNVAKNDLNERVRTVECALSDTVGTTTMAYEWEHAVAAPLNATSDRLLAVETTTGDSLCQRLGCKPDVIKIDVEGQEVKVVRGLIRTIHEMRPLLFVELHPLRIQREGGSLSEMLDLLRQEGYRARRPNDEIEITKLRSIDEDTRVVFEPM